MPAHPPHPLARYRRQAGMSVRALARASGVSYPAISHIENGHTTPHPSTRQALADALGVPEDKIWFEDGNPKPKFQQHPDDDPDVIAAPAKAGAVIYLDRPRVDYVDARGRVVRTETPDRVILHGASGMRVEVRARARRTRRTRKASARSSSDDPGGGEPALTQAARP